MDECFMVFSAPFCANLLSRRGLRCPERCGWRAIGLLRSGEPVLGLVVSRWHQRPSHFIDGRCLYGGAQQLIEVLQIRDGFKRRL